MLVRNVLMRTLIFIESSVWPSVDVIFSTKMTLNELSIHLMTILSFITQTSKYGKIQKFIQFTIF